MHSFVYLRPTLVEDLFQFHEDFGASDESYVSGIWHDPYFVLTGAMMMFE